MFDSLESEWNLYATIFNMEMQIQIKCVYSAVLRKASLYFYQ